MFYVLIHKVCQGTFNSTTYCCVSCGKVLWYLLIHPVHINIVTLKVWGILLTWG